jgi:tetratricopeptide (TPR) repeat protein
MKAALIFVLSTVCLHGQPGNVLEQADAAFREGNVEQAATLARRALTRDPRAVRAHMILGVIAAKNRDWNATNTHFRAVVRLEPSNSYGYFYLGQAGLYQHRWDEAIKYFSKALELKHPEPERLLIELALARNEAGQPEAALADLSHVTPPADELLAAQYHAVTAFATAKLNRPGAAIAAIQRALQLDDSNPQYWEFLIATLIRSDEAPHALAEAIRAQRKFPDHADIQFLFALASYHVTESPLSKLALRNLREADSNSPRVLLAEGLLARKQGRNEDATAAFQRAAKAGAPDALLLLGIVYKENGDYDAAEREYREAARQNPENGQVLLELGKLMLIRGQLDEARILLEKAEQVMPDAATVQYQLGLVYRRLGQTEKAQQHFKRSKQPEADARN